jgi:lysophospholipase L1-like esterase
VTEREQFLDRAGRFASVCLAAAGTTALLVFLRFLYHGLSGQRRFSTWRDVFLYYLLPAGVAVVLWAALRLEPLARLRLLMAVVALTVSAYGLELALVLAGAGHVGVFSAIDGQVHLKPAMAALADARDKDRYAADLTARSGSPVDVRTAAEVIADLHAAGIDALPIVTPSNHLFLTQSDGSVTSAIHIDGRQVMPLASVSGRTTLLCNENGPWIRYRSDHRGFNNPEEAWPPAAPLDVAALGDSFAHGYCVPRDENFVDLIRRRHAATLNLGMAGDGPLLMLATLEEYLRPLAPKIVLWCYYEGNDLTDLQVERRSALLGNYLREGFTQPDLTRQADIDRAIVAEIPRLAALERDNVERRSRTSAAASAAVALAKLTAIRERLAPVSRTDPQVVAMAADFEGPNIEAFRDILSQARRRVEAWDGQLYFVYLPEWSRYTNYRSWGKDQRENVLALVRSLGIPIIDIEPAFQAHGDPLSLFPFREVGHYTAAGHRLVAEEVLRHLPPGGSAPR